MKFCALSYGDQVEIIKPQNLREEMFSMAQKLWNIYSK